MAGVGGYQPPANPAPVSGPGALSKRTDGGPTQAPMHIPSDSYGAGKEMDAVQASAPLAAAAKSMAPPAPGPDPLADVVPLDAPSRRDGEPVTHGIPFGDGAGPEALTFQPGAEKDEVAAAVRAAYAANPSPYLNLLLTELEAAGR